MPYMVNNLVLSLAIFCIGIIGFLVKRNTIAILMAIELMLNAANLAFVTFARSFGSVDGTILVLFVITVAAAEAAVGLAIFIRIYRRRSTINADQMTMLRE
jgi:NADH-quinone oxidoreductase subunit K